MKRNVNCLGLLPKRLSKLRQHIVGVWIPWNISSRQSAWLKEFNARARPGGGIVGVYFRNDGTTSVTYTGPIRSPLEARAVVIRIMRMVSEATGACIAMHRLPDEMAVRRALYT